MNESFAKEQLRRCAGMPGQPTDEIAIKERIKALCRFSRSETHLQRIMDSLVNTNQFFPTVSDIRDASEYISGDSVPNGCQRCSGEPFVSIQRGIYSAAVRCECERGKYLAARDREKKSA